MFREQKGDECGWSRIRKQESGAVRGWGEAGAKSPGILEAQVRSLNFNSMGDVELLYRLKGKRVLSDILKDPSGFR